MDDILELQLWHDQLAIFLHNPSMSTKTFRTAFYRKSEERCGALHEAFPVGIQITTGVTTPF